MKLVEAQLGSITEKAVAVGQIQPRQKFCVKSKISGIVKRCRVEVGDRVKAGDPLFEIVPDPTPLELDRGGPRSVESAQATYQRAQLDFDRVRGAVPAGDRPEVGRRQQAARAFELAKIALEKAEQDRELTRKGRRRDDRAPASSRSSGRRPRGRS